MARAPFDVDPKDLHVEPGKRQRRRKRRDLPEPTDSLKADKPKVRGRLERMPLSPGLILEPRKDGEDGWVDAPPHSDRELWDLQLHAAFGTRSRALVKSFVAQLKHLCRQDWDEDLQCWKWNETDLNAALALVSDIQPRNAVEAALAAQMVAVHVLQMNLAHSAFNSGGMVMEKDAALASKLARTFTMQVESLRAMRGGKKPTIRQVIKVTRETHYHQHKHLHDHRGVGENDGQPHDTRTTTIERSPEVPSDEPGGQVLRLPSRPRTRRV